MGIYSVIFHLGRLNIAGAEHNINNNNIIIWNITCAQIITGEVINESIHKVIITSGSLKE